MRTPYDHAVESDGEDDPMWDDYFDPESEIVDYPQDVQPSGYHNQPRMQLERYPGKPSIKTGYAIKSSIRRTLMGVKTGSPVGPGYDHTKDGNRRSARTCSKRDPTSLSSQTSLAAANYNRYQQSLITMRSPLGGTGLFTRKHLPAGYEIDYYGEYFASIDELIEAGQDESQYVIGERKRNGDYHVVVNGKSVPKQFAIYANHQPNRKAGAATAVRSRQQAATAAAACSSSPAVKLNRYVG